MDLARSGRSSGGGGACGAQTKSTAAAYRSLALLGFGGCASSPTFLFIVCVFVCVCERLFLLSQSFLCGFVGRSPQERYLPRPQAS
jgi:hypothetical protein